MKFWQQNKKLVVFLGVSLFVMLIFLYWSAFPIPFTSRSGNPVVTRFGGKDAMRDKAWVEALLSQKLKDYYPEPELVPIQRSPTKELFYELADLFGFKVERPAPPGRAEPPDGTQALRDYTKALGEFEEELNGQKGDLQATMELVTYEPFRVPKWEEEPGFYFMRTWRDQQGELEEIRAKLEEKNQNEDLPVYFDPKIGFSFHTPPSRSKTPFLLDQLSTVRDVIELALTHGINRIDNVVPSPRYEDKGSADSMFFSEYPVAFGMHGTLPAIMEFLNSLKGVHGEVVIDEKTKFHYVNRGSEHGLRSGEKVVVSRDGKFVTTATVEAVGEDRARLAYRGFNDGLEKLEPAAGDRVSNHFYVLRTLLIEPSRNPIYQAAGLLEMQISLAAVKFKEREEKTEAKKKKGPWYGKKGKGKAGAGGGKREGSYNYRY